MVQKFTDTEAYADEYVLFWTIIIKQISFLVSLNMN